MGKFVSFKFSRMFQSLVNAIDHDFDFAIAGYPNIRIILRHELPITGSWSAPDDAKNRNKLTIRDPTCIQYAAFMGKTKVLKQMIEISHAEGLSLAQIFEPKNSNTEITVLNLIAYAGHSDCLNEILKWLKGQTNGNRIIDNFVKEEHYSPLCIAVDACSPDMVSKLLNEYKINPLLNSDKIICALMRAISNAKGCAKDSSEGKIWSHMCEWLKNGDNLKKVNNLKWADWMTTTDGTGDELVEFLVQYDGYGEIRNYLAGDKDGVKEQAVDETVNPDNDDTKKAKAKVGARTDAMMCSVEGCNRIAARECEECHMWLCNECDSMHEC